MTLKKFLIVGAGGRESAFAQKLMIDSAVYAVIDHKNPTICDCVERSGGQWMLGKSSDPETVVTFALKHQIDYAFISSDEPLAKGVVDALLANNIKAVGGTKAATKIEWDKIYSIDIMQKLCPEYTPFFRTAKNLDELKAGIETFEQTKRLIVVKPQGLTGGKGVKVMPIHLETYDEAYKYGMHLLQSRPHEQILLVEKIEGIEFTIMGITDGKTVVLAPATYDYPFRYEGDVGAGTGGMGCFTSKGKKLPFMDDDDLEVCQKIMQKVIDQMAQDQLVFNGVLNGGFFKTTSGIKFMEFNGRFGDPEGLNILSLLNESFSELVQKLWYKTLKDIAFLDQASVVKYLVAKEYPNPSPTETHYKMAIESIKQDGVETFFSSSEKLTDSTYTTLKKSRVVALVAIADDIETASNKVNQAIEQHIEGTLEYRPDIGLNLESLRLD